jgi:hypothetical protein
MGRLATGMTDPRLARSSASRRRAAQRPAALSPAARPRRRDPTVWPRMARVPAAARRPEAASAAAARSTTRGLAARRGARRAARRVMPRRLATERSATRGPAAGREAAHRRGRAPGCGGVAPSQIPLRAARLRPGVRRRKPPWRRAQDRPRGPQEARRRIPKWTRAAGRAQDRRRGLQGARRWMPTCGRPGARRRRPTWGATRARRGRPDAGWPGPRPGRRRDRQPDRRDRPWGRSACASRPSMLERRAPGDTDHHSGAWHPISHRHRPPARWGLPARCRC